MKIIWVCSILALSACVTRADSGELDQDAANLTMAFSVKISAKQSESIFAPIPIPFVQQLPEYPLMMRQQAVSGIACLSVLIRDDGTVESIVLDSASEREFGEAAKKAIECWRFKPARRNGHNVIANMVYTFEFRMHLPEQTDGRIEGNMSR